MVDPGNLWCIGVNQILAAQRLGDGSIRVGVSLPAEDRHLDTYRSKRAELATNAADPDSAIQTHEEAMFTRNHPIAEISARVQAMMLSPTAADDIVRFFTPQPTGPAPVMPPSGSCGRCAFSRCARTARR
ncbi:hypothetical protein [Micromonospora sp. NPDC047074]|uniref:hypothetical protein n=1 Tax=Micromonospora sp. NPDC047074 TaxID=3154339 RepID=UPI00340F62A8